MKITRDEVLYMAKLARLNLDQASVDKFAGQIDNILEYIDMLKQVNTDGIPPTSHAISLSNAFRDDVEKGSLDQEKALMNAPEQDNGYFIVPKVIGG